MDMLFCDVTAVTMDQGKVIEHAYVGIKDGKITYLGEQAPEEKAARRIDGRNKVLLPGLVNIHTHIPMTLLRGYADDYVLQDWLNDHIFPAEARLDPRAVSAGVYTGLAEMIASGTTSFSDTYFFCEAIAEAVDQAGIKANLARSVTNFGEPVELMQFPGTREEVELKEKWHNADNGRIRVDAAIHAEYTTSETLWKELGAYAREQGLLMQVHLSETRTEHEECVRKYGKTPARLFCDAGVFDARTIAAHCVWATDEDLDIFLEKGVSVAHNPVSNLKLASGVARVPDMLRRGINVGLGTDGVASNNSFDMFEEIKLAAILHKGVGLDPTVLSAPDALALATVNGAAAQGRQAECGRIASGLDADLILVDFDKPHLTPCHNPVSNLVYAARGSDVCMTLVRGRVLYENGEFTTIDWERVKRELADYAVDKVAGRL